MNLDRIGARIRPRRSWEGIDLGFALARQWFLPLWALWWLSAAPAALVGLIWLRASPDLGLLLIWWLKPLYEAPLIGWLGRALFGEQPPLAAAVRRLPRALPPRLWPYLLWRRFSPARSLTMTMTLLERLRGGPRRQRAGLLTQGSGAGWLTIVCVHFEAVLWLSGILLLIMLVPEQLPVPALGTFLFDDTTLAYWIGTLIGLLGMSIIAPCYVAAGFAAYLTRRTELEAWDLELRFRHGGAGNGPRPQPRRARQRHPAAGALSVAAIVVLATLSPGPSGPAAAAAPDLSPAGARTLIDEVLAGDDFGHDEQRQTWVYVGKPAEEGADAAHGLPEGFWGELILALAQALKWLLLVAAAVGLALLTKRLFAELGIGHRRRRAAPPPAPASDVEPGPLPGASVLPADVPAAVRDLLARGQPRAALALLYRAQIEHLRHLGLDIRDSATEAECLAATAASASPPERDWLHRLMALWQQAAYAHRPVSTTDIEGLLAMHPAAEAAP